MILGLDGPVVALEARAAALLARPLERLVADARRRGEEVDPSVLAALADCERVRRLMMTQARASSANGSDGGTAEPDFGAEVVEMGHEHSSTLSTTDAAALIDCSTSYVRRLARQRRFGVKVAGTWLFSPAEVAVLAHQSEAVVQCPSPSPSSAS